MLSPLLEEIGEENKGKATIYKLNVDENQEISQEYHVHSIPTVIVFKDGKPQGQFVGVQPKENYVKVIDDLGS